MINKIKFILLFFFFLCLSFWAYNKYNYLLSDSTLLKENYAKQSIITGLFITSIILSFNSKNYRTILKSLFTWIGIFIVILGFYSYRFELLELKNRILANLIPTRAFQIKPGTIEIKADISGHYQVIAEVNGKNILFLVDTGASVVSIPFEIAKDLGINVDKLQFNTRVRTANGHNFAALSKIDYIKIGDIRLDNLTIMIVKQGLGTPLLGMNFLNQMSEFNFKNETLVIRKD
jgi:aspartyl protease family protein